MAAESSERQVGIASPNIGRDRGAFGETALALNVHGADDIGVPLRVEALDAQQNHRRAPLSSHRQVRVEIVVQRDTHS
jgi:hypothetical protein